MVSNLVPLRFPRGRLWFSIILGIVAILWFIVKAIFEDWVQDAWNEHLETRLDVLVSVPLLWTYIVMFIGISGALALWALSLRMRSQQLEKVAEFYESMFRKLSEVKPPLLIMDEPVIRTTTDMLKDLGEALGGAHVRSYILVPSGDWLVEHSHNHVPKSDSRIRKFYIGHDKKVDDNGTDLKRGVAGASFVEEAIQVAHVNYKENLYTLDHRDAISNSDETANPGYSAFICVPLILGDRKLGVLCVDSHNKEVFDNETQQDYLAEIGVAFAGALAFCVGDTSLFPTSSSLQGHKRRGNRNGNKTRSQKRQRRFSFQQGSDAGNNR